ncbi:unnamed protein product [Parnassius mnemosyne]|uniref:Arrestin C-terminal-like domain-containing protein n=1 Tax=Parnassius mnemosyne TaxID=213953 RepID=A0AAV1M1F4_9NEOP
MVWENCNVTLNSGEGGILYTGEIVTGSVIIEFKKEQKIEYVEFKVIGITKARWSRVMPTVPYLRIYSGKCKVLDTTVNIFSEINGKKIQPGMKNFQFHFNLPSDLPSTFKSSIAKVYYYIRIKCKGSFNRNKIKIVPFVVMSSVDLNHRDDIKVPMIFEMSKAFTSSGTFLMYFKTYRGFASKQRLTFEIDILNEKKVKISKIVVTLIQKLEYTVSTGYANAEKKICKTEHNALWNNIKESARIYMDVPQTAPSSINVVNPMIDISYVLRVEVIFKFHFTLLKDIPVTIATVPVLH